MKRGDIPAPREGVIVTHFLVVRDQDTSREWYRDVLGAEIVNERDPLMLTVHNSWLILNIGGGPTDDKPEVTLKPPSDPSRTSAFLNLRVADIQQVYEDWSSRGLPQEVVLTTRCARDRAVYTPPTTQRLRRRVGRPGLSPIPHLLCAVPAVRVSRRTAATSAAV